MAAEDIFSNTGWVIPKPDAVIHAARNQCQSILRNIHRSNTRGVALENTRNFVVLISKGDFSDVFILCSD
jgi:glycerol kinase